MLPMDSGAITYYFAAFSIFLPVPGSALFSNLSVFRELTRIKNKFFTLIFKAVFFKGIPG